jgi:flagellar hook-associated protein 2
MSSSSVSSSTSSSAGSVSSLSGSSTLQITGLASGLDTDKIITQLMQIQQQPITNLQNQESKIKAQNTNLTTIQTALKTVSADAMALMDPSLFHNTQAVSTSDSTKVTASTSTGAGVGGYQVEVSQLANSAQRTFTYASPSADDSISIDGQQYTIKAGESINDFVAAINNNKNSTVYAAATDSGTVVFSNRATGNTNGSFISVSDGAGALTEQASKAKDGKDAIYSIDGVQGTSSSNTVTNGIAGVSLTLTGVTTQTGPVTVNVAAPAPSTDAITGALKTFITDYNSALSTIQSAVAEQPDASDPTKGTLYGDTELQSLLSQMRTVMYGTEGSGGISSMLDLGVSTGATTGSATPSASALAGNLTLDPDKLAAALASNPSSVQHVLEGWANDFSTISKAASDNGGTIDSRISGDSQQISQLDQRIADMQAALTDKQNALTQQFAALEAALSSNQSTSSWLTSQIAALPGSSK